MNRFYGIALLLVLLCLCGYWQPVDPDAVDVLSKFAPISRDHLLGTDHLGRDVLSRIMVGGWRTGTVLCLVALIGFVNGTMFGSMAALLGGWAEEGVLRTTQLFLMVPTLIIALCAASILGLSPVTGGLALGLAGIGQQTLMAHGLTKRLLGQPFILSAHAMGLSRTAILFSHVLPNTLPTLFTYLGNQMGAAAVAYASLAFIGLGVDPSKPDWGSMLFEYRMFIFDHPMLMIWPGIALSVVVFTLHHTFDHD
ncbi:peptide/nickel transport system permease protein [Cohaesibacter sp. ES.047]|uniref:ABC transporter permease n=1 Tax=Cohaesibacter sp. ES.047 TaxID=1798205 RepID=UPI000BB81B65|nr:ABC transporter permease [Cohaesibacter sp. ES.047]SNY93152.1 peptide/nickel transport system permease protein [Cohaesibacter sp. ES.047]